MDGFHELPDISRAANAEMWKNVNASLT